MKIWSLYLNRNCYKQWKRFYDPLKILYCLYNSRVNNYSIKKLGFSLCHFFRMPYQNWDSKKLQMLQTFRNKFWHYILLLFAPLFWLCHISLIKLSLCSTWSHNNFGIRYLIGNSEIDQTVLCVLGSRVFCLWVE